jgi:seryl-tRNA synthetase
MDNTSTDDDRDLTGDTGQVAEAVQVDTEQSDVVPTAPKLHSGAARKRMIASAATLAVIVVVGVASFAVGHSGKAALRESLAQDRVQLSTAKGQLSALQSKYATVQGQLSSAQSQLQQAQATAQRATATAEAKAKAQYAAKMSAVDQEQHNLNSQEQQVKTELGQLQASSISGAGVYVVGHDIKSGVWHTNGDGGMTDNECYYATLSGSDTITDITDNNNFDGDETVDVSGAYALQISGPCTWYLAS